MNITTAPASLLDVIAREDGLPDLNNMTPAQKSGLFTKLGVVIAVTTAPYGQGGIVKQRHATRLDISTQAIDGWISLYKRKGFRALVDQRKAAARGRALLPAVTKGWITDKIIRSQRADAVAEVHRQVLDQWQLWRRTGDPQWALPGYLQCPADCGKGYPPGMSYENFRKCQPTDYQASLARQGTIASYRMLPSILTSCIGLRYLQYVFFDDQKYDVQVRVMGYDRPMVPLGFNSLDRVTRFAFAPHIRLRWFDEEDKVHKALTQREFVWYVITRLCTEGYRTDEVGTTYIQEHGTAKAWANKELSTPDGFHSFQDAVHAFTGGCVKMDDSGLFNKPAFTELLYGPKSSGNPRFKAPIESFFHAVRIYCLPMIGQTGRNIEEAPEENYGIDQYERNIIRAAQTLPPRLRDGLLSNYLTGVEFGHIAMLAYDALNARTDHHFKEWEQLGFCEPVWRWAADEPGRWRSRSELAGMPQHLREHALHEQSLDARLSDILPWSPAVAKMACESDPCIKRLRFEDAIHLVPTAWWKPVKVRDRHQLHVTDDLLPGQELIYLPEITTPRGRKDYLRVGDEILLLLNPLMPDEVLVCDMSRNFLGTLVRNIPVDHDGNQLDAMFRQRARLKDAMEGPVHRAMQPVADRRAAVKQVNAEILAVGKAADEEPPMKSARPAARPRAAAADPFAAPPSPPSPAASIETETDPFV